MQLDLKIKFIMEYRIRNVYLLLTRMLTGVRTDAAILCSCAFMMTLTISIDQVLRETSMDTRGSIKDAEFVVSKSYLLSPVHHCFLSQLNSAGRPQSEPSNPTQLWSFSIVPNGYGLILIDPFFV